MLVKVLILVVGYCNVKLLHKILKLVKLKVRKILLSLGGAAGSYGFTDDSTAKEFATTLWELFGNSDALSTSERPFSMQSLMV